MQFDKTRNAVSTRSNGKIHYSSSASITQRFNWLLRTLTGFNAFNGKKVTIWGIMYTVIGISEASLVKTQLIDSS